MDFAAGDGSDDIEVGDLTGTGVTSVGVDLGKPGGPDGFTNDIIVHGTQNADDLTPFGTGTSLSVIGLPYAPTVTNTDPLDRMEILAGGGDDEVTASGVSDTLELLFVGGAGADTFVGGTGDDIFFGDAGDDDLDGGAGADTIIAGDGDDRLAEAPVTTASSGTPATTCSTALTASTG